MSALNMIEIKKNNELWMGYVIVVRTDNRHWP